MKCFIYYKVLYLYHVHCKMDLITLPLITDTPIIIRHNPIRPVPVIVWRPRSSLDITAIPVNRMAKPIVVALIGTYSLVHKLKGVEKKF